MRFQKYLGDSKMFEYDKYYRECQQQNKPFIKAKTNPAHGNYFIQMDLMTCNYKLTPHQQKQIQNLTEDEIQYVKSHSKHIFKEYNITDELAWFDGVSSEHLDDFCNFLYDITEKSV